MEKEEKEDRDYDYNKESGACLEIIENFADTRNAERIFTDDFRFVYGKRVGRGVVITLGGEDKIAAAVINFVDSMRIENAFAINDGPVGDDVIFAKFFGLFYTGIKNKVTGKQGGVNFFGMNGENPYTENVGDTVA